MQNQRGKGGCCFSLSTSHHLRACLFLSGLVGTCYDVPLFEEFSLLGVSCQCKSSWQLLGQGLSSDQLPWYRSSDFLSHKMERCSWKHQGTSQLCFACPPRQKSCRGLSSALSSSLCDGWACFPSHSYGKEMDWKSSSSCYEPVYKIKDRYAWQGQADTYF